MLKPQSPPPADPLPLSLMTQSAFLRIGVAGGILLLLWIAIIWAVAKP